MESIFRSTFKWTFILGILVLWTFLVLSNVVSGSFAEGKVNIPIYTQTIAGIEKISFVEIIDFLFNKDFLLEEHDELVPFNRCSVRADDGNLSVKENSPGYGYGYGYGYGEDGENFFSGNNHLGFYVNYLAKGSGSLTSQEGRDRVSLSFEILDILKTDSEDLVMSAKGKLKINRVDFDLDNITLSFNKDLKTVNIKASGEKKFELNNSYITFTNGCEMEERNLFLLIDNGDLEEERSIEEVRELLGQHPEFHDAYENINKLYRNNWESIVH